MALTGKIDKEVKRTNNLVVTVIAEFFLSITGAMYVGYGFCGGDTGNMAPGQIIATLKNPEFDVGTWLTWFWIGFIVFGLLFYYSWMQYERLKNTRLGEEHGTSAFLKPSDMPHFRQSFFFDPKVVGKVEGWAGNKKLEKKNTFYNDEELKKVCKKTVHSKKVFDACFKNCQIMGQDVYLSMNCKFINRNLNTLTVGGSGQGKSYSELFPNAMLANCNYIFTDPSGEILQKVGKFLKKKGYKLKVFNVDEFDKSMKYNPLVYVETEKDYNVLVDALNKNIKGGAKKSGGSNEFFDDAKDSLMCALFALLKELYPAKMLTKEDKARMTKAEIAQNEANLRMQTLKNVMRLLLMAEQEVKKSEEGEEVTSTLDEMFAKLVERDPRSYAAAQWKSFKVGGPKVCNEVIISAAAVFGRFFNTDDLEWLTSYDDLNLYELASEKKCALFLVTPQDTTTYNFMAAMIYSQLFGIVMKAGKNYRDKRGTDNPALPRHLSFWLDEFANIGKIPNFLELLSVVRKYNISINIIIQGMAQLKGLYKESEWEVILANLDTMIYLGGMEPSTVKWLAEKMGKTTIKQISSNRNAKTAGENYSNMGRNLMTTDEIEQMARAHELVFISGCKPIQTKKYDLATHPNFKYCGEADPANNYNIRELVPEETAEIDYELLDQSVITPELLEKFDFNSLRIRKGHKARRVESVPYSKMTLQEIMDKLTGYQLEFEKDQPRTYYSFMLEDFEKDENNKAIVQMRAEVESQKVEKYHPMSVSPASEGMKDGGVSRAEQEDNAAKKAKAREGLNMSMQEMMTEFLMNNEVDYEGDIATEDDSGLFGDDFELEEEPA